LECGGVIKVICVPSGAKKYSNSVLKKSGANGGIYNEAHKSGAKGLPFLKITENGKLAIPYQNSIL